jgi:hypothetical protein
VILYSHANIFIPKFRPGFDEIAHEPDARRVLQHFHFSRLAEFAVQKSPLRGGID